VVTKAQASIIYANEADVLNVAVRHDREAMDFSEVEIFTVIKVKLNDY